MLRGRDNNLQVGSSVFGTTTPTGNSGFGLGDTNPNVVIGPVTPTGKTGYNIGDYHPDSVIGPDVKHPDISSLPGAYYNKNTGKWGMSPLRGGRMVSAKAANKKNEGMRKPVFDDKAIKSKLPKSRKSKTNWLDVDPFDARFNNPFINQK